LKVLAFDECATLWEIFQRGKRVSNDGNCLGWRKSQGEPFSWYKYSAVEEMGKAFGAGLLTLGIGKKQSNGQSFLGIYCQNNPKWLIAAESAWMYGMGIVPLYDTLGPTASSFIINQAGITSVMCDTVPKVRKTKAYIQG
jgi:long-chain acyl-CoA synthetase